MKLLVGSLVVHLSNRDSVESKLERWSRRQRPRRTRVVVLCRVLRHRRDDGDAGSKVRLAISFVGRLTHLRVPKSPADT